MDRAPVSVMNKSMSMPNIEFLHIRKFFLIDQICNIYKVM